MVGYLLEVPGESMAESGSAEVDRPAASGVVSAMCRAAT
jgi:hypothetical protein